MSAYEALVREKRDDVATVANVISLSGLVAGLLYLKGGSPAWAVASIVADEVDGRVARAMGQTSEVGSALDWGVDMTLMGAFATKLDILPVLPPAVAWSAYLRGQGISPPLLSSRALMMIYALGKYGWNPLP